MEERIPGIQSKRKQPCIKFLNQAEFHPLKYLQGLAKSIIKRGGSIYSETKAIKIETTVVETENGQHIDADHIVVATNSPVNDNKIYLKQFAYRTYMIGALIKKNSLSHALWWDTGDFNMNPRMPPYHYVRIQSFDEKNDLLLCGGEDHPTGLSGGVKISEEKRYDRIERWLKQKFSVRKVAYRWSGQVMETMDGLAFIGKSPGEKNIYIVTGDSGNGLTHGTIAGILIPDLILEKKNEWEELYRPSRVKVLKAGKTWLQEFGGGFFSYLKESPSTETIDSIKSLHRDEVTMVKKDKKKLGVYRDGKDQLHVVNTECTHLGCTVKWNTDERSWDCPCHGSRFTYEGRVLNGPAIDNLEYHTTSFEKFLASKNKMQSRTVKKSRKVKNKTVMSP